MQAIELEVTCHFTCHKFALLKVLYTYINTCRASSWGSPCNTHQPLLIMDVPVTCTSEEKPNTAPANFFTVLPSMTLSRSSMAADIDTRAPPALCPMLLSQVTLLNSTGRMPRAFRSDPCLVVAPGGSWEVLAAPAGEASALHHRLWR